MIVETIIREVASYYNKKVIFNTGGEVNSKTKSFKLNDEVIGDDTYLVVIRLNTHDDFIEVIHIAIQTFNSKDFIERNKIHGDGDER